MPDGAGSYKVLIRMELRLQTQWSNSSAGHCLFLTGPYWTNEYAGSILLRVLTISLFT
jgi:hypothetical protein